MLNESTPNCDEKNTPIIEELNANVVTGFQKSVDELYNDIIKLLKHRTAAGFRVCRYNKKWSGFGTMMSPVHIGYEGVCLNAIPLSDSERARLLDAVCDKLTTEMIKVNKCQAEYITSNNVNYTLAFEIDLEVTQLKKKDCNMNSASHSPDTHEYDFKCGSC
jgi:hypothetical protein